MKASILGIAVIGLSTLMPIDKASAHVSYSPIMTIADSVSTNGDATTYLWNGGVVSGNFGWADATDADWGDTHLGRFIKFEVSNAGGALIDLTVAGSGKTVIGDYFGTPVLLQMGDLTPAFSIYKGLAPVAGHDGATPIPGKEGVWQALNDFTIANDLGVSNTLLYKAHAGSVDSNATSASLSNLFLEQGVYSLVVGGSCYACQDPLTAARIAAIKAQIPEFDLLEGDVDQYERGFTTSLTIQPVPVPSAIWFMGSGLFALLGIKKHHLTA